MRKQIVASAAATLTALPGLVILAAAPARAADTGSVAVTNTETVQAYLDATGKVDVARVYEQVAMRGKGLVQLQNPVEPNGLRNLDGFGGFDVRKGVMVGTYDVDGEQLLRTVSDYDKKLPLEVSVAYRLDGKPVTPDDVVGRSGRLEVRYSVRNVTGVPTEVTFDDGTGGQSKSSESVVIPMVGSLTTTLPNTFTDVTSGEANIAGDGRGGTKLTFTMTLFGPIGAPEATFGYTAEITDGVVPKAAISALPVSPLESPSFKGGAASYKGGADTGITLTAGATEIDANLLKLRDGAGTLLAGLIQLRDGAKKLDAGFGAQILPGSRQLAAGAGDLKDGTGQLRAGAGDAKAGADKLKSGAGEVADGAKQLEGGVGQVASGAGELHSGAGRLATGAQKLDVGAGQLANGLLQAGQEAPQLLDGLGQVADGLERVDAGLVTMYGGVGDLPAKAKPLHDGIAQLRGGIGAKGQADTLIDGVDQIREGLAAAVAAGGALDQLKGGVDQSKSGVDQSKSGVDQSKSGVDQVRAGLEAALSPTGGITKLDLGVGAASNAPDCGPICKSILTQVTTGLAELRSETSAASDGLGQVSGGLGQVSGGLGQVSGGLAQVSGGLGVLKGKLSDAATGLVRIECGLSNQTLQGVCDAKKPGLLEGLGALDAGLTQLVNGVVASVQGGIGSDSDTSADGTLRGGVHSLQGGVDLITAGGLTLLEGLSQLSDGASALKSGTAQLASGTGELQDGTGRLVAGTSELRAGSGRLASGAGQVADGAGQLAGGLGTLAEGAGRLDDGAGRLDDGAGQLADGLVTAADGTSQIASGLTEAADGAPAIKDGAQRLSDEGTKKLVEAGKATAADYGEKYALITAGAERAKTEGMAYGAPQGAAGFTAYSLELAGVDGSGARNAGRVAGALGAFALAGGLLFWRRRVV